MKIRIEYLHPEMLNGIRIGHLEVAAIASRTVHDKSGNLQRVDFFDRLGNVAASVDGALYLGSYPVR